MAAPDAVIELADLQTVAPGCEVTIADDQAGGLTLGSWVVVAQRHGPAHWAKVVRYRIDRSGEQYGLAVDGRVDAGQASRAD